MMALLMSTPESASVALKVMVGRGVFITLPFAGATSWSTGGIVSGVENVKANGVVCTLLPLSVAPLTVTVKTVLVGRGAAGVNTACVDAARTVLPATGPDGPVSAIRVARLVLAARGSLKLTWMVVPIGTCGALLAGTVDATPGGPVKKVAVAGCSG